MPRTESSRAICPSQRDRGDVFEQKFFEPPISNSRTTRRCTPAQRTSPTSTLQRWNPFPIDFWKRPQRHQSPPGKPDEFPPLAKECRRERMGRDHDSGTGSEHGYELGDGLRHPAPGRVEER